MTTLEHPWRLYLDPHLGSSHPLETTTFATVEQVEGYVRQPGTSDVQKIEYKGTEFWIREEGLAALLQKTAKLDTKMPHPVCDC